MGAKGFYEGETAKLIVEEMKERKGMIYLHDLKKLPGKRKNSHCI